MSLAFVDNLLRRCFDMEASDLHLKVDNHPLIRLHGELFPQPDQPVLTPEKTKEFAYAIMNERQQKRFETELEMDLAYELEGVARFRTNMMIQRGCVSIVMRLIPTRVKTMDELFLPPVCKYFCERPRGLVLVTGPTGSGKSTTLAAMINHINDNRIEHIMTVEDPIEFVHDCKNRSSTSANWAPTLIPSLMRSSSY